MTAHEATPEDAPALLLIGTGERHYRQDALKSLAARYRILLIDDTAPTWQQPFLTDHQVSDLGDTAALNAAASSLAAAHDIGGVLTWNPAATAPAAAIAQLLGTAGLDPAAVRASRHQAAAHAVLDAHGVASARWVPVGEIGQLRIAAEHLGYPLVLKPAIAGSGSGRVGAVRVDGHEQLDAAYAFTARAAARHGTESAGLLAEEYHHGPEVGVEVVSVPGRHVVAAITHTQRGQAFEVTDRLVAPALRSPVTDTAEATAVEALEALGITHGVSHVTVRLTASGPKVTTVTPCLADDLIPHLVRLATGIDLVAAAADLAMGLEPDLRPGHLRAAAIGFRYPHTAGALGSLTMDRTLPARNWCDRAVLEQQPGVSLAAPADGDTTRLAHLVVTADTPALCRRHLDRALSTVHATIGEADDRAAA
ncbi:acetyl-CoA carboxylase biotin carboxylase subunit family protein [Streptomyces sp. NPDC006692]|uniref:ATP-grasp domain-containing protein n=1 Tax=unclassified Streptomyces TaxID=2593676 RepID=UPI0034335BCA